MKPSANSIGVSKMRLPRQVVASQLKILIPVGTAIDHRRDHEERVEARSPSPVVNMWCAQTSIEKNAMPIVENATAL